MREHFVIYTTCFSILMGGSMIAFLLGIATNKDACFVAALVLFFVGLLLTVAWARTSMAARWLLAGLLGLTLLMGVQYLRYRYHRALQYQELMEEKIKAAPVQQMADE